MLQDVLSALPYDTILHSIGDTGLDKDTLSRTLGAPLRGEQSNGQSAPYPQDESVHTESPVRGYRAGCLPRSGLKNRGHCMRCERLK